MGTCRTKRTQEKTRSPQMICSLNDIPTGCFIFVIVLGFVLGFIFPSWKSQSKQGKAKNDILLNRINKIIWSYIHKPERFIQKKHNIWQLLFLSLRLKQKTYIIFLNRLLLTGKTFCQCKFQEKKKSNQVMCVYVNNFLWILCSTVSNNWWIVC